MTKTKTSNDESNFAPRLILRFLEGQMAGQELLARGVPPIAGGMVVTPYGLYEVPRCWYWELRGDDLFQIVPLCGNGSPSMCHNSFSKEAMRMMHPDVLAKAEEFTTLKREPANEEAA